MCQTTTTHHTPCHHTTSSQIPCSHPTAGLSLQFPSFTLPHLPSFISSILPNIPACPKSNTTDATTTWCPSCTSIWDALNASREERDGRVEEFRSRTGYQGVLEPKRRLLNLDEAEGTVVFNCEGEERCIFLAASDGLGEEEENGKEKGPIVSTCEWTSPGSAAADNTSTPSVSVGLVDYPAFALPSSDYLALNRSKLEGDELWPRARSPEAGDGKRVEVDRDRFGELVKVGMPVALYVGRGGNGGGSADRSGGTEDVELGEMDRDGELRRALAEDGMDGIRAVAPMVAGSVAKGGVEMLR